MSKRDDYVAYNTCDEPSTMVLTDAKCYALGQLSNALMHGVQALSVLHTQCTLPHEQAHEHKSHVMLRITTPELSAFLSTPMGLLWLLTQAQAQDFNGFDTSNGLRLIALLQDWLSEQKEAVLLVQAQFAVREGDTTCL